MGRATVVARHHHDGVVVEAGFLQGVEDGAEGRVGLHHEIGVWVYATFAAPFCGRDDGRVRRIQRHVEEKGFSIFGVLRAGFDVADSALGQLWKDVFRFEVGSGRT